MGSPLADGFFHLKAMHVDVLMWVLVISVWGAEGVVAGVDTDIAQEYGELPAEFIAQT